MVLFTILSLLYLAVGASEARGRASQTCRDEDGADVCSGAVDESNHLLQLSSRSKRASSLQGSRGTKVKPLDCNQLDMPIQVQGKQDGKGFVISELNISTGVYNDLFDIPFNAVKGGYSVINACGINPSDNILYCAIFAGGSWIVRLDGMEAAFVVRLPQHGYNTADFSSSGVFYIADPHCGFIVVKDLDKLQGFSSKWDKGLLDLRKEQKVYPKGWFSVADVVVVEANLEGCTTEYLVSLYGMFLQIARYNLTSGKFSKAWSLHVKPRRGDNIFGAGWNFAGKVFFATNRGSGVYQVPLENITLENGALVELKKIGNSAKAIHNDGVNCRNAPDPYGVSKVTPFDCSKFNKRSIQLVKKEIAGMYEVAELNAYNGTLTQIFNISFDIVSPPIEALNGAGISPKDSIMYAMLGHDHIWEDLGNDTYRPSPHFLVRFNAEKIEYVAKLNVAGHPISGTFDKAGNYYTFGDNVLYRIESPDAMKGFENKSDPELPVYLINDGIRVGAGFSPPADLVVVEGNFDGEGDAEWVISLSHPYKQVFVMKYDKASVKSYSIPAEYPVGDLQRMAFGSGWNFDNQAFFGSNDGVGVFKIPLEDIVVPPPAELVLNVTKVGQSAFCPDNDGMNCMNNNPVCKF